MPYLFPSRLLMRLALASLLVGAVGVSVVAWSPVAEARVGGGRSVGRAPSPAYRRQAPMANPQAPAIPRNDYRANPYNAYPPPRPAPQAEARNGGFLRNMAGGLAGGFLGSMLFNSMGHGMGGGYGGGYGGGSGGSGAYGGGGGVGLLDLLLLAGVAYLGFRWWRSRQVAATPASYHDNLVNFRMPRDEASAAPALAAPAIDAEQASDLFFRIQGAWTRRDLTPVQSLLGPEVAAVLNKDLQELKAKQQINRLENISIRHVDVGPAWYEDGATFATVRFTANLLDYTVDEASAKVVDGSDSVPVKFVEDWTFAQANGSSQWQLVGIEQVN